MTSCRAPSQHPSATSIAISLSRQPYKGSARLTPHPGPVPGSPQGQPGAFRTRSHSNPPEAGSAVGHRPLRYRSFRGALVRPCALPAPPPADAGPRSESFRRCHGFGPLHTPRSHGPLPARPSLRGLGPDPVTASQTAIQPRCNAAAADPVSLTVSPYAPARACNSAENPARF